VAVVVVREPAICRSHLAWSFGKTCEEIGRVTDELVDEGILSSTGKSGPLQQYYINF